MEEPTYEQVSEMMKAIVLDIETPLADEFPETFARLEEQVAAIIESGQVPDGFAL